MGLDLGEPSSVAELFTEDGSWAWPEGGRRVEGREALREYFGSRPADRLSRRLMSNVLATVTSPDTATATSYFSTYGGRWLLETPVLHLAFAGPTPKVS
ncbi:nuclear transport factor 2 family protein [Streptomyces sp. NPDC001410]|uniref:nuclear transport factor 2 family protein n=1 Tax=Streptomyces sp. NPDC001410 TaxID=3364574 RepID=UPI0036878054